MIGLTHFLAFAIGILVTLLVIVLCYPEFPTASKTVVYRGPIQTYRDWSLPDNHRIVRLSNNKYVIQRNGGPALGWETLRVYNNPRVEYFHFLQFYTGYNTYNEAL
jgi:hypothetical protein